MIYTDFHGEKLPLLGFGTMRLPLVPGGGPADIDEKTTADMVRYAMDHGVNYFDTAYPYHGGMSERVIGRVLKGYDRQSFYLATKYPGHQISDSYDPAAIFEEQLRNCGVEYFDFAAALAELVDTGHLELKDDKYSITEKGRRNGKICEPVRGASLVGKGSEILQNIDMVGTDMDMGQGMCGSSSGSVPTNVGQPLIRVSSITVGGR